MNFDEYQAAARRTLPPHQSTNAAYQHMIFGLLGELGEVTDLLKKHMYHMHDLSKPKLREELGDLLWYVSNLASIANLSLDDIGRQNERKLEARYPDGFDSQRSIHRKEEC